MVFLGNNAQLKSHSYMSGDEEVILDSELATDCGGPPHLWSGREERTEKIFQALGTLHKKHSYSVHAD